MKLRNIIFTLIILIVAGSGAVAQFAYTKTAEIDKLKQGTVAVAISDDEDYNKTIEEIMSSVWTACKYKVIKNSELADYIKMNPQNYIISYLELKVTSVKRDRNVSITPVYNNTVSFTEMLVVIPDRKSAKKADAKQAMFRSFVDADLCKADSKAELTRELQSMNTIFTLPGLEDNQMGPFKMLFHYPTADAKKVIAKELWIASVDADADDSKMKSVYPYNYKIVSKDEIAAAINAKRKDIVYVAHIEISDGQSDLYTVQDAETNTVLQLLNGTGASFGYRHLEQIKNEATTTKKKK